MVEHKGPLMKVGGVECTLWEWLVLRVCLPLVFFKSAEKYVDDVVAEYEALQRAEFAKGRAARSWRRKQRRKRQSD